MNVSLNQLSKRYRYNWVFKGVSLYIESGDMIGISGLNGSGKSTLIKIISGQLNASQGNVSYRDVQSDISRAELYRHISIVAPYVNLIEEFTLPELYQFQGHFKDPRRTYGELKTMLTITLDDDMRLGEYSSGMLQRIKLAMTAISDTTLVLLDEPTTFLDSDGVKWFHDRVIPHLKGRTTIISSNESKDFAACKKVCRIEGLELVS